MLWAVQRAFTGEPDDENGSTPDIGARELVTIVPLIGLSLFLGFFPKPVLDRIDPSVQALVTHVQQHSDYKPPAVSNAGPLAAEGKRP
jgi:NADH-quinone oxidoreductase subunit M